LIQKGSAVIHRKKFGLSKLRLIYSWRECRSILTSSYAARKYPEAVTVRVAGRLISPVLMGIGLLLLIVDAEAGLKDPLRFIYLFTNFNSVMTIGTYFISLFMVAAAYIALIEILKKDIIKIAEYVGIVFAVATAIYTGFLIGVIGAVPLWNTAILPILFVVSSFFNRDCRYYACFSDI
jgi:formate-dependent nitrite reductase membrane component NrfD